MSFVVMNNGKNKLADLQEFGNSKIEELYQGELGQMIRKLVSQKKVCKGDSNIKFDIFGESFENNIENLSMMSFLPTLYCGVSLCRLISTDDLVFLLSSIFHERTLIFVSEDKMKISSAM